MNRTGKWTLGVIVTAGLILGAMQNCSQVDFAELQKAQNSKISQGNVFVVGTEPIPFEEDSNLTDNTEQDLNNSTNSEFKNEGGTLACGGLQVRDVIIDILSVEAKMDNGQVYQLNIGGGPADLLDLANGIDFIPEKNLSINQLRIVLGEENYVLGVDDKVFPLRTPNQQNSGLIVLLNGRTELAKDVTYHLAIDFDPQFDVRSVGRDCQFHPNVTAIIE